MAYLTEDQLSRSSIDYRAFDSTTRLRPSVTVFLSHSHKDREFVKGWIARLQREGVEIYVDWNDTALPSVTNRKTAEEIKRHIAQQQLFAVLATRNAMESKWVPWEIGVADQ